MDYDYINTIEVRNCREEDLEEIFRIEMNAIDPWSKSSIRRFFKKSGLFVVASRGEVLGYAMARIEKGFKVGIVDKIGHLVKIVVKENERRKGIGTLLMQEIFERLKQHRIDKVWLEVRIGNNGAIKFYHKLDFKEKRQISGYFRDGEVALILVKEMV